jgi:phytol kinase
MSQSSVWREVRRKSIHAIPGFMAIPFIVWLGRIVALVTALFFFILYTLNEISLRKNLGWRIPIAYQTYIVMARREELEEKTFIGTVYFWGLTVLIILLLPPIPAAAAVMISSLGDATAAIIGRKYPKPRNPLNKNKSITGSTAMLLVSTLSCILLGYTLIHALVTSIPPTIAEALTRKSVNDEITVPVTAAITSYITYILMMTTPLS